MSLTSGVRETERTDVDDLEAYARDTELRALDFVDKLTNFRDQLIERIKTYEEIEDEAIARDVLDRKINCPNGCGWSGYPEHERHFCQ